LSTAIKQEAAMNQPNILLVEDESGIREMYRTIIAQMGLHVREAANYDQAVALLNEPFDLALVDLVLGDKSGIELLKYIHQHHPDCLVIIVSAYASKDNAIKALREGAVDYLEKPVDSHELSHVIRHWMSHQSLKRENMNLREESGLNREIRESELRYRALIEAVPNAIVVHCEGKIVFANPAAAEMFRAPNVDALNGQAVMDFVDPGEREVVARRIQTVLQEHRPVPMADEKLKRLDGEIFHAEVRANPVDYIGKPAVQVIAHDISERRKAEEELKQSEQRYRAIFESIQDMYYRANMEGELEVVSPSCFPLTGYKPEEVIGRSLTEFYADPSRRKELMNRLAQNGKVNDFEAVMVHKDGSKRVASITSKMIHDSEKRPIAIEGIARDITERKQAESFVREEKHVLEMLATGRPLQEILKALNLMIESQVPGMRSSILILDDSGKHLLAGSAPNLPEAYNTAIDGIAIGPNAGSCGTAAFRNETVIVNDIATDPLWEDYRNLALAHGLRACWSKPVRSTEGKMLGTFALYSDKPHSPIEAELALIASSAHIAGIAIEHKQIEERIKQYSREMELLADASQHIIGIQNADDLYHAVCEATLDIFDLELSWIGLIEDGSSELKAVGVCGPKNEYITGITVRWDDSPQGQGPSGRAIRTGEPQVCNNLEVDSSYSPWRDRALEYDLGSSMALPLVCTRSKTIGTLNIYSCKPGFFTENRVRMLRNLANQAATAIENIRLVTHLEEAVKQRTAELLEAKHTAESANRAKSAFLANMSHELRTPLTSIIGFSELMAGEDSDASPDTYKEDARDIAKSGRHLLTIINDILDLSKIEAEEMPLNLDKTDIHLLVDDAVNMVGYTSEQHHIALERDVPADIGVITVDEQRIRQVLTNLLSNAVKFTPDNSQVNIKVRGIKATALRRKHGAVYERLAVRENLMPPAFIKVSVTDSGIGIDRKDQDLLFQPFQQVDVSLSRKYEGTGLGLALCKSLVEMHGGAIWLEASEPGKGSTFSFVLPV